MNKILITDANIDKQYFAHAGDDMRQLLSPLRRHGVAHFTNVRVYEDTGVDILTTHPSFSVLFYREKFYRHAFAATPDQYDSGIVLTKDLIEKPKKSSIAWMVRNAAIEHAGYSPDLIFLEKESEYVDLYFFGTLSHLDCDNSFYLNRLDIFARYISFFKSAGSPLISKAQRSRLYYEGSRREETALSVANKNDRDWVYDKLLKTSQLCRKQYNLTKKEQIVACYLANGCSNNELSDALALSPRTIEKYIDHLKFKFRSRNIRHLISQLNQLDWIE